MECWQKCRYKKGCAGVYRYGFNGKEKDTDGEWGSNTHYDYGFRIYNPAIAKFLSVDPLTSSYPYYTPYQFAGNKPIWAIDLDGLEPRRMNRGNGNQNRTRLNNRRNKRIFREGVAGQNADFTVRESFRLRNENENRELGLRRNLRERVNDHKENFKPQSTGAGATTNIPEMRALDKAGIGLGRLDRFVKEIEKVSITFADGNSINSIKSIHYFPSNQQARNALIASEESYQNEYNALFKENFEEISREPVSYGSAELHDTLNAAIIATGRTLNTLGESPQALFDKAAEKAVSEGAAESIGKDVVKPDVLRSN